MMRSLLRVIGVGTSRLMALLLGRGVDQTVTALALPDVIAGIAQGLGTVTTIGHGFLPTLAQHPFAGPYLAARIQETLLAQPPIPYLHPVSRTHEPEQYLQYS